MSQGESLGKASLDLTADTTEFRKNMDEARSQANQTQSRFDLLAEAAKITAQAFGDIRTRADQAAETSGVSDDMKRQLMGISLAAASARADLEGVRLKAEQAAETDAVGDAIDAKLDEIGRNADQTKRKLEEVKLASGGLSDKSIGGTSVGLLGAGIAGGALLAPSAGPALLGVLASVPALVAGGVGALGTLKLAFDGVGKAIEGNKQAFDRLMPAQQQFVETVRSLTGWFDQLKQTAAGDLFPGLTAALHDALSPSTLGAVTHAIAEFATAIGNAAQAWGKYIGSPEFASLFGPLMAGAARALDTASTAALKLFDAFGVLGRAALPLVGWMTQAAQKGAQLVDTWMHNADASGRLASAMQQAQTSLRLVGGLLEALGKAAGALGAALYPVSQTAVRDLTNGLNGLAGIIQRNQQTIRDIVGGALSAFVTVVKDATAVVRALWPVADRIVSVLGGWKTIFEGLIALKLASVFNGWATSLAKLAGAGGLGGAETSSAGLLTNLNKLKLMGPITLVVGFSVLWGPMKSIWEKLFPNANLGGIAPDVTTPGNPYPKGSYDWQDFNAGKAGKAYAGGGKPTAAYTAGVDARLAGGGGTPLLGPGSSGTYSASQLASLWVQAGGDPSVANLMAQVALSESSGRPGIVNSIGATGLWQIYNGPGHPGGLSQYLNPLANAKAAVAKYNASGLSPWDASKPAWSQTAAYQAYLAGQPSSPFGPDPAWTSGLGSTSKPKPPVIPNSVTDLLNRASENATKASQLGNAGGTAKRYLDNELSELETAKTTLDKLTAPTAAGKAQISKALTSVTNKIAAVQTAIKNATLVTGDALLPDNLKATLAKETAKYKSDVAYAQVLTGDDADKQRQVILNDLEDQRTTLEAQVKSLTGQLKGKTPKQKAAIDAELKKVESNLASVQSSIQQELIVTGDALIPTALRSKLASLTAQFTADTDLATVLIGQVAQAYQATILGNLTAQQSNLQQQVADLKARQAKDQGAQKAADYQQLQAIEQELSSVQQQILQSLQSNVQTLQSKVSTLYSSITSEFDAQFEAQTQAMLDKVALADYQNGALNPDEALLQQMQAEDTAQSLQDALTQAIASGDQASIAQAQRAIDENNLAIKATAERAAEDADYAAQTKKIQADRTAAENAMNQKLAALGDAFENGSGSMSDLTAIAAAYGIQISGDTIPDFANLSGAVGDLKQAFADLASYIATITGKSPDQPGGSSTSSDTTTDALPPSVTPYAASLVGIEAAAGKVMSKGLVPQLASGAVVYPQPGGTLVNVAEAGRPEVIGPLSDIERHLGGGSGGDIILQVDGREFARINAQALSRDTGAQRVTAKAVDPHLSRIVKVGASR